jgi:hypothetical protein
MVVSINHCLATILFFRNIALHLFESQVLNRHWAKQVNRQVWSLQTVKIMQMEMVNWAVIMHLVMFLAVM